MPSNSRTHESLMASMMARSTPRVFFHSALFRHSITALEVFAAVHAIALLIILCAMHIRFVRSEGCAPLLADFHLRNSSHNSTHLHSMHGAVAPVVEIAVPSSDHSCSYVERFRFSHERGFLLLSDQSLAHINVSIATISLSKHHPCLGDAASRFILFHFLGYETVALNAFARMRRRIKRRDAYVLSITSRRVMNLLHADPAFSTQNMSPIRHVVLRIMWKCGAIMTAVFIMCTTCALVAFTLREVQLRMIKLTMDLQVIMRSQLGYGRVVIRYAMDALVFVPIIAGMLFFLFEFFDDQVLAFAVLVITWLCEFAASGSTRHWISRLYLPRLFFCYFGAFHVYFFSFPLGFSWLAFVTSIVFMVHAALSVWNHCEIPLLRRDDEFEPDDWR